VMLHCDGAIQRFMPDLIEAGFEALNPIESTLPGMNPAELKARFGSEMVFLGGVDVREALARGTVEDVRHEVRLRIAQMAPGGGYICAPSHNFTSDVPLENILAFFEAAREFGEYPIPFDAEALAAGRA
jgi:uroporphyrinogen decarboxylase